MNECSCCRENISHVCVICTDCAQKLAWQEYLRKEKRLIELPCKVGDTVWTIEKERNSFGTHDLVIQSRKVLWFSIDDAPLPFVHLSGNTRGRAIRADGIDKMFFIAQSEAIAKAAELRKYSNGE